MLERAVPGVEVLPGSAEAIPLPDASVDTITVGQAFHWFRPGEALVEMHRVLRPGGGFALLWNDWDDDDPLLHALNDVVDSVRPAGTDDGRRRKAIEDSAFFGGVDERRFHHAESLGAATVVDRVSSVSVIAAANRDVRERALAEVAALVGTGTIHFPMITTVLVADLV